MALTGTPLLFFIPFHFGHRAGSFVRDYDRWARTELHSHNPTLPITQSSVASVSQADDGPDETGSKQTKSWKRAKPFPEHRDGTYCMCVRECDCDGRDEVQGRLMSTRLGELVYLTVQI